MAFPASTTILAVVMDQISRTMGQVRSEALQIKNASVAGPIGANNVVAYVGQLADHRDLMSSLSSTPGLAEYAREQFNSPGLDIGAEFTATLAQIDATRTWIVSNFPKAGTGELLEKKLDANGRVVLNTFSTASLTTFRAQLDALIATIV